ncbi:hypothetical protein ABE493_12315 [Stenotrophomonas terrae]|uniref:hypothetical protein n=1 Tax=Stenotrophomonas terrae TaxID=405446 RepID=UPI003208183B
MDILYFITRTPAIPAAMYLLLLTCAWCFSRLLFDAISILGLIALLMAFLASSGEASMIIALIAVVQLMLSFAGGRLQCGSGVNGGAHALSDRG